MQSLPLMVHKINQDIQDSFLDYDSLFSIFSQKRGLTITKEGNKGHKRAKPFKKGNPFLKGQPGDPDATVSVTSISTTTQHLKHLGEKWLSYAHLSVYSQVPHPLGTTTLFEILANSSFAHS